MKKGGYIASRKNSIYNSLFVNSQNSLVNSQKRTSKNKKISNKKIIKNNKTVRKGGKYEKRRK
jgi:hypothetical protein